MPKEILYIEDNLDFVFFVERELKNIDPDIKLIFDEDFEKIISKTGIEIFPDVILLDINLTQTNGIEIIDTLRKKIEPNVPIIMFTNSKNPKQVKQCFANGANAYVLKPVGLKPLNEALKNICTFWLNTNFVPPPEEDPEAQ